MGGFGPKEFAAALAFVRRCDACVGLPSFRETVLDVDQLVPGGPVACSEVDLVDGTLEGRVRPEWLMREDWRAAFERWAPEHPVVSHMSETGDLAPRAISDMVTAEELHATDLYREFFARIGTEDQISFGLPSSPRLVLRVAINRPTRGFEPAERDLLAMLAPHLGSAYLAARARSIASADPGTAVGRSGENLVVVDEADRVSALAGRPQEMLAAAGVEIEVGRRLPSALDGNPREEEPVIAIPPIRMKLDGGVSAITVRAVSGGMPGVDRILMLSMDADALTADRAAELEITPREVEVANLLARGLSNPEIVERLQLSPHTLKRHLEHLYAKLGVGSRAEAVIRLLGAAG